MSGTNDGDDGAREDSKEEADSEKRYAEQETEWAETIRSSHSDNDPRCTYKGPKKPSRDWVDYSTLIALIATFFAALGAAFEADRLATDSEVAMEHSDRIANGAADQSATLTAAFGNMAAALNRQATSTDKLVGQARTSAQSAQTSAHAAQNQVSLGTIAARPYIVLTDIFDGNLSPEIPFIQPILKNAGNSPAFDVSAWICGEPYGSGQVEAVNFLLPDKAPNSDPRCYRSNNKTPYGNLSEIAAYAPFDVGHIYLPIVPTGNWTVVVWGEVDYRDMIARSKVHHFHFCYYRDGIDMGQRKVQVFLPLPHKPECNTAD